MNDEKSSDQTAPQEPSLGHLFKAVVDPPQEDGPPWTHTFTPEIVQNDNDLIGNPDALEWANRFCMRLNGLRIANTIEDGGYVNIGGMLPWFASAIETGRMVGTQQHRGAQLYEVEGSYRDDPRSPNELKLLMIWTLARSNAEARENFMAHCHASGHEGPLFRKATVRSTGHMPLVIR